MSAALRMSKDIFPELCPGMDIPIDTAIETTDIEAVEEAFE